MFNPISSCPPISMEIRHAHMFCGLGGGAKGFNAASARVGNLRGKFRCIGGIDVDAAAIRDFTRLSGVSGTVLDLFSREQYVAFHGAEPPRGWSEATVADVHAAFGHEHPHIVFLSAPCKGFSGLLANAKSKSAKYQALNGLTLRGIWLMLEAYKDDLPELIIFENVPRIASRGRDLLDQIQALLRAYGYAVAETTHDCGQLGGLAQSRKRFLMVARHAEKVPSFLYEPAKRPLRAVGDVLSRMPMPGHPAAGPMHRLPALQWKTWVRLAFVEAGSDWRSLNRLAVQDGFLRDYAIVPMAARPWREGSLGVLPWAAHSGTITGRSTPTNGQFSIADVRAEEAMRNTVYGVTAWNEPSGVVAGKSGPGNGKFSVADALVSQSGAFGKYGVAPWASHSGTVLAGSTTGQGAFGVQDVRVSGERHSNVYRVIDAKAHAGAVTTGCGPSSGGQAIADTRPDWMLDAGNRDAFENIYRVVRYDAAAQAITGASHTAGGAASVADPMPGMARKKGDHYYTQGSYGVLPLSASSGAVSASACHDNGFFNVADVRCAGWSREANGHSRHGVYGVLGYNQTARPVCASGTYDNGFYNVADVRLPDASQNCKAIIIAEDGTWHRPFTTLELAALQSLVDPEELLELDGLSDSAWRERIGNAVPPDAATAVAAVMGQVLLLTWSGETFSMSQTPIWVAPMVAGLMSAQGGAV